MSCYHPLIRVEDISKWQTALDGHRYHPAKIVSPEKWELEKVGSKWQIKDMLIPCGKCIGCRLDYSREWANRGYLESKLWEQNWFVTITYDDDNIHIPEYIEDRDGFTYTNDGNWTGNLVPKHLQQFVKDVRQIMKREYNQDGIRFMACGEYGAETARPHYHIIFFNLNLPVTDLFEPRIINKELYYRSHIIERAWKHGISNISECTWNTIAYTARYITKKINGPESEQLYASNGKLKEFMRVSRMPGIGEGYYQKHWEEIYKNDEILIQNKKGVISSKPPKYFDELYKREHPKEYEKLKAKRQRESRNAEKLKDQQTTVFRSERLEIEERLKDEQTQSLIRKMEASL